MRSHAAQLRCVLHLDLDCFYAQVEHKRLNIPRHVPLVVQQWDGIIALNYAAKAKGVRRGDNVNTVKTKHPDVQFVHVETIGDTEDKGKGNVGGFDGARPIGEVQPSRSRSKASLARYREASSRILSVMQRFSETIERASIDEVYIDVTEAVEKKLQDGASDVDWNWEHSHVAEGAVVDPSSESDLRLVVAAGICKEIRDSVKSELDYDVSAGISHNKLVSKLASAMNKPNKQTIVPRSAITNLMRGLEFRAINGLGGKLGEQLSAAFPNCVTAFDLQRFDRAAMDRVLGEKSGGWLYDVCRGEDYEPVKPNLLPKSLNACKSFPPSGIDVVVHWLGILSHELIDRMAKDREANRRHPKVLVVHARQAHKNDDRSRQCAMPGNGTIPKPTRLVDVAKQLFDGLRGECLPCVRIAMGVGNFVPLEKDMRTLSSFFAEGREGASAAPKRSGGIDLAGSPGTQGESGRGSKGGLGSGRGLGDVKAFFSAHANAGGGGRTGERAGECEGAGGGFDLEGVDVSEQARIMNQIRMAAAQAQPKKKRAKTNGRGEGQKSLGQFWGS